MSDDYQQFDDAGDELFDHEYPDEELDRDDADDTVPCPHCGADVYDDAFQCPICGEYVEGHTSPLAGRPLWWVVLGMAGLGAAIYALVILVR